MGAGKEQHCQTWIGRSVMENLIWEEDFILVYFAILNEILKKVILIMSNITNKK